MKNKFLLLFATMLFLNSFIPAQEKAFINAVKEENIVKEAYPVHAREYLEKFYEKVGFDPQTVPLETNVLLRKTSWSFQEGTQWTWKAIDIKESKYYEVSSTCRAVGENCYIFVEDAIWGQSVNQAGVDSVRIAFDFKTPANPNKGIFQTNIEVFGNPPDIDGDPKIIILILDIKDFHNPPDVRGYVAGYFSADNQLSKSENPNSNEAEIFFIDGVQSNLTTTGGINTAMSTVAHEFQHMIRYGRFDMNGVRNEGTFFDECLSLTAEIICGYSIFSPSLYANEPNIYLTDWRKDDPNLVLNDYSRAARFGLYLYEQFGTSFFYRYRHNLILDRNGFDQSIKEAGTGRTYESVLKDWFVANYINNRSINEQYGYYYSNLPQVKAIEHFNPEVTKTENVYNFGSQYIAFTGGSNLNIRFNNSGINWFSAKAIKYNGTSNVVIEDIPMDNSLYSVPELGSSITKVIFLITYYDPTLPLLNNPKKGPYTFTYTATGTAQTAPQELAFDSGIPDYAQVQDLIAGDSIAVVFNGLPGYKLDSIRVALRQAGSMNGGVWKYTGVIQPTPLGQKYTSFTATSTIAVRPSTPYPNPYNNWVTVDLRSSNIDASQNFVAAFIMAGQYLADGSGDNRVMVDEATGTSPYPSMTYPKNISSGSPRWVYIIGEGTVYHYLVRAYISSGVSDIGEVIELLPSAYSLEQNYPNPFNPSTIISYQIPNQSRVQVRIFDVLGREIRSLINEEKSAGKYNIAWDGRDNYGKFVSSGNYFYTITAGDFVQTKKMVLMK